jgi:hypothetical protein
LKKFTYALALLIIASALLTGCGDNVYDAADTGNLPPEPSATVTTPAETEPQPIPFAGAAGTWTADGILSGDETYTLEEFAAVEGGADIRAIGYKIEGASDGTLKLTADGEVQAEGTWTSEGAFTFAGSEELLSYDEMLGALVLDFGQFSVIFRK